MSAPRNVTLLASAARTATPTDVGLRIGKSGESAIYLILDLTAFVTAADLAMKVFVKDPVTDTNVDLLAATSVTAVSTVAYLIGLGISETAIGGITKAVNYPLPDDYLIEVTHGNANSHTYSLGLVTVRY